MNSTDFERRRAIAFGELAAAQIPERHGQPPIYRALWWFGVRVRPPHYERFWVNTLVFCVVFGPIFAVMLWFLREPASATFADVAMPAIVGAVAFGLGMGLYYRASAARHSLTPWDRLLGDEASPPPA